MKPTLPKLSIKPAPMWQFTTIWYFSSRGLNTLFWSLHAQGLPLVHRFPCRQLTYRQYKENKVPNQPKGDKSIWLIDPENFIVHLLDWSYAHDQVRISWRREHVTDKNQSARNREPDINFKGRLLLTHFFQLDSTFWRSRRLLEYHRIAKEQGF